MIGTQLQWGSRPFEVDEQNRGSYQGTEESLRLPQIRRDPEKKIGEVTLGKKR